MPKKDVQLLAARTITIKRRFDALRDVMDNGVRKNSHEWCLDQLVWTIFFEGEQTITKTINGKFDWTVEKVKEMASEGKELNPHLIKLLKEDMKRQNPPPKLVQKTLFEQ